MPDIENFDNYEDYRHAIIVWKNHRFDWIKNPASIMLIVIRWVSFIPIAFILTTLLYAVPPLLYHYASTYELSFTLLSILTVLFSFTLFFWVVWLWGMGVFYTPILSCVVIAPNNKVASIVYGIFFASYIISGITFSIKNGDWIAVYSLLFSVLHLFGVVIAYREGGDVFH